MTSQIEIFDIVAVYFDNPSSVKKFKLGGVVAPTDEEGA